MDDQPVPLIEIPGEDQEELDRVDIQDNGELLVDFLGLSPKLLASPTHPVFEFPRTHLVRQSVAEMLVQAAEALPDGLFLSVIEGYRPISVQRAMYAYAIEQVTKEFPGIGGKELEAEAGKRSAPPNAVTPPPHLTGGAVDVDIVDIHGKGLDFSSPYSRADWKQASSSVQGLSEQAAANRKILWSAMGSTGLTNYVDEWWHWSYGDNGWALRTDATYALYGRIELPKNVDWIGDISKLP